MPDRARQQENKAEEQAGERAFVPEGGDGGRVLPGQRGQRDGDDPDARELGTAKPPFSAAQLALSSQMIAYWTRFAATGSPNRSPSGASAPAALYWPRFSAIRPDIQELVADAITQESSAQFAAAHKCAFWAGIGAAA